MTNLRLARPMVAAVLLLLIASSASVSAKDRKKAKPFIADPVSPKQSIRFYKANKALQVDRISFTGGETKTEGCHNFIKKTRVYKTLQVGFGVCHLYAKKNCEASSLVAVENDDQRHGSFIIKEGVAWFLQSEHEQGEKVGSWSCNMTLDQGEMRFEYDLIRSEAKRLNGEKSIAKERLEAAQEKFAKAEKATEDAKKYTKRVKQEALAMGVIKPDPEPEEESEEKAEDKTDNNKEQ